MSKHEDLSVQYHQQDTSYYCGAACAQMVLDSIGTGLLAQSDLYTDNHNHSTTEAGWYTAPDGLNWTLNNRMPASFSSYFVLDALANEDSISRMLCWTIHHYKVAPVAMVYGSQHWIVVRGYEASAAPSNSGDIGYTISAFDVNNPWPPTPAPAPPPPHGGSDACGSGGMRGIANEHITYATWQTDYMTGIAGGYWGGKFVAVCDPDPPPTRVGRRAPRPTGTPGVDLISRDDAKLATVRGLEQFALGDRAPWKAALADTSPGDAVLVQRLDRLDSFYYIVPLQSKRKGATAVPVLARVDARFGIYQQAALAPEPRGHVLPDRDHQAVLQRVQSARVDLEGSEALLKVRPEAVCVYPTLVWQPCRESLSPFYPFHMLIVGAQRLYVRTDGAIFTQLHADGRGI